MNGQVSERPARKKPVSVFKSSPRVQYHVINATSAVKKINETMVSMAYPPVVGFLPARDCSISAGRIRTGKGNRPVSGMANSFGWKSTWEKG